MKVIAEIGLSHEGSLGQAMAYCDAVAKAGADIVKFQCHTGDPVSEFRPDTSFPQDQNRQAYWARTAFNRHDWEELEIHAHNCGLELCVSYFSHKAVDLLDGIKVDYHKLGSAQTSDLSLVKRLSAMESPLILSSGMSSWRELDRAVAVAIEFCDEPILMHCVSKYPTPPQDLGLSIIGEMIKRYPCARVGYSDHSGEPSVMPRAVDRGAVFGEVHVCWHRQCFGADVAASVTIDELKSLVHGVRIAEQSQSPVDKDEQAKSMADMRRLFRCEK